MMLASRATSRSASRSRWWVRTMLTTSLVPMVSILGACTFGPPTVPTTTTTSSTSTTTTTTLPPTTTSTTTTTTTTLPPTTTTTTIPLITEGAVAIVANASNVNGAAAQLGQELAARGFHMADATNAAGVEERLAVSKVYFLPAGADVAASIARVMGGVSATRMPVPVSITGGPAALGEATVVVMLGSDLANKKVMLTG